MRGIALFTCMLLLAFIPAFSQPVINSSITPKIGLSFQFMDFDSTKHEPGGNGSGQIWDFSKVTLYDTATLAYLDPKDTPYGYMFPEANMAMTSDKSEFDYFIFNEKHYAAVGDMGMSPDYHQFCITTYSKPAVMLQYPVTYMSTFEGSSERIVDYPGEVTIYQKNKDSYVADAWGTLILPTGKFENALRIKRFEEFQDSMTDGKRYLLQTQRETRYQWFIPGITAPIVTISRTISTGKTWSDTAYSNSMAVLLKENYLENRYHFPLQLAVHYAGPSSSIKPVVSFMLPAEAEAEVLISDASGKTLLRIPLKGSGKQLVEFDPGSYASGIYLISVKTKALQETIRWIKH